MDRQSVESSAITSVGYDSSTSILEIEFKSGGAVWEYYDVPESVYYELMSGSVGTYFHANIKNQYSGNQIG